MRGATATELAGFGETTGKLDTGGAQTWRDAAAIVFCAPTMLQAAAPRPEARDDSDRRLDPTALPEGEFEGSSDGGEHLSLTAGTSLFASSEAVASTRRALVDYDTACDTSGEWPNELQFVGDLHADRGAVVSEFTDLQSPVGSASDGSEDGDESLHNEASDERLNDGVDSDSDRLGVWEDRARPKLCFSFCFRFVFRFVLPVFLRRSAHTKNKTKPEILQNSARSR